MSVYLTSKYNLELDFISKKTVKGEISGVQIDCIAHQYSWIQPFVVEGSFRLASLQDIAAMKLNAISGNGTRIKDFIDIAFLSGKLSTAEMLYAYEKKYKANPIIALKAITFFDDINFDEPIKMLRVSRFNWGKIAKRLADMQKYPNKIFAESVV